MEDPNHYCIGLQIRAVKEGWSYYLIQGTSGQLHVVDLLLVMEATLVMLLLTRLDVQSNYYHLQATIDD